MFKDNKQLIITLFIMLSVVIATIYFSGQKSNFYEKDTNVSSSYNSKIDFNKVQENINALGIYKVYDAIVPVTHTSTFKEENKLSDFNSFLGLDEEITITATADCYYEYVINLSKCVITESADKKVTFTIPRATLNKTTIKRIGDVSIDEDKSSENIGAKFAIENSNKDAMILWEDSFEESAYNAIKDNEDNNSIDINTKLAIKNLAEKFNIKEEQLIIKIV